MRCYRFSRSYVRILGYEAKNGDDRVTDDERLEMIEILFMVTGWNKSAFEKMDDNKLESIYQERVVNR